MFVPLPKDSERALLTKSCLAFVKLLGSIREAGKDWKKNVTGLHRLLRSFVHLPFYNFPPSDPLLRLIYLLGYVLYGGFII